MDYDFLQETRDLNQKLEYAAGAVLNAYQHQSWGGFGVEKRKKWKEMEENENE